MLAEGFMQRNGILVQQKYMDSGHAQQAEDV